jgi:thymidylate kinase
MAQKALKNRRAVVVVLEGVDGSGKSALAAAVITVGRSLGTHVGYVKTSEHGSLERGPCVSWLRCMLAVLARVCFSAPRVWRARRSCDVVVVERGLWGEIAHHPRVATDWTWTKSAVLRVLGMGGALRVIVDVHEEVAEARFSARDDGGWRDVEDTLCAARARREALLSAARNVPERCLLVDGAGDALLNASVILRHTRSMARLRTRSGVAASIISAAG